MTAGGHRTTTCQWYRGTSATKVRGLQLILLRKHALRFSALFQGKRLRARSLRATALVFGSMGVTKALQLGSNLILTRLLFPEAFGLMALVGVFIAGIQLVSDIGIRPSLIRSTRSDEPIFQSTAWTLQVVRGGWITGLSLLLAWPYSKVYDEPMLAPLISIVAFAALFSGFASIQNSMMARHLILGKVVTLQIVGRIVDVIVMVSFAWLFQSVWGLAIGNVVGTAVTTALSLIFLPSPNHRFAWDRSVLDEIVSFGRWILLATLFTFLGNRGLQAVRGYLVDLDTLAFLHIALMFSSIVIEIVQRVLNTVGYPGPCGSHPQEPGANQAGDRKDPDAANPGLDAVLPADGRCGDAADRVSLR